MKCIGLIYDCYNTVYIRRGRNIRHVKDARHPPRGGRITSVTWRMHNIRHVKDVWHHAEKMHGAQQQQQSVVARPWNRTVAGVIRAVLSHPLHPTFCWKAQFAGPPKSCWFINVDGLWWHRLFVEALEVLENSSSDMCIRHTIHFYN